MRSHLSLAIFLMSAQAALAQGCACSSEPIEEQVETADYAFVGRSRGTGYFDDGYVYAEGEGPWLTSFDVLEIKKGNSTAGNRVYVRHDEDPLFCGIRFSSSETYLVVGKIDNKRLLTTDACSVVPMPDQK